MSIRNLRPFKGFTLIELLIVVAIIAILAAIAVPNFLEAQTRAKVSRAKADMRTMATAVESYRVDNNRYPIVADEEGNPIANYPGDGPEVFEARVSTVLTTPIAYITARLREPFPAEGEHEDPQFHYGTRFYHWSKEGDFEELDEYFMAMLGGAGGNALTQHAAAAYGSIEYFILSHGPDLDHDSPELDENPTGPALYDPTNGTTSSGDIVYWGPGTGFRN